MQYRQQGGLDPGRPCLVYFWTDSVNNLRVYLDRLIWSIEELANKGVLKPSELQGVSWDDY
jgi:hypothetical protein